MASAAIANTIIAANTPLVEGVDGFLRVDVPPAALEVFASPYHDQVFHRVSVDDGRLFAGTPDFPARATQAPAMPDYYDPHLHARTVRAAGLGASCTTMARHGACA